MTDTNRTVWITALEQGTEEVRAADPADWPVAVYSALRLAEGAAGSITPEDVLADLAWLYRAEALRAAAASLERLTTAAELTDPVPGMPGTLAPPPTPRHLMADTPEHRAALRTLLIAVHEVLLARVRDLPDPWTALVAMSTAGTVSRLVEDPDR